MVETPANDSADDRMEELRQRWEEDRSSRVFLQLAEQLRQADRFEEAIAVLGVGLEHHPGWGAAQVALARCQLAVDQAEQAALTLETVVRKDPTQMVAYRLLVDAYLELGDPSEAKDRLELYAELNPEADDLQELEERVQALSLEAAGNGSAPASAEETAVPEAAVDITSEPPRAASSEDEARPAPSALSSELGDSFDLPSAIELDSEPDTESAPPEAVSDGLQHLSGADAGAGATLEAEAEGAVSDLLGESRPLETESAVPPTGPEPESLAGPAPSPAVFGVEPRRRPEPSLDTLGSARPLRPLGSPSSPSAATAATALEPDRPPQTAVSSKPMLEEPADRKVGGDGSEEESAPTVTLGQIYLRQGHVDEARRIFEAVLEADPDHGEARAALRALQGAETELRDEPEAAAIFDAGEEQAPGSAPEVPSVTGATPPSSESPPAAESPEAAAAGVDSVPEPTPEPIPEPIGEPGPGEANLELETVSPPPSPQAKSTAHVARAASEMPTTSASEPSTRLDARTLLRHTPIPAGLTDRKVAVLEGYLERIQSARTKDVP